MNEAVAMANLIEAVLWFAFAIVLFAKSLFERGSVRITLGMLAVAFVVFGISDLIESRTGAWWRPLWLMLLKGTCIVVIVLGFAQYYRLTKRKS